MGEYLNSSIPLSIGLSALSGEYGEWFFKFAIKIKRQYLQPATAVLWTDPVALLTASQGGDIPMTDVAADDEELPIGDGTIDPTAALSRGGIWLP